MIAGLAFSDDDARLASASFDGTIRVWDLRGVLPLCLDQAAVVPSQVLVSDARTGLARRSADSRALERPRRIVTRGVHHHD